MSPRPLPKAPPAVVAWLWTCVVLLLAMILIGGVTRLTGSGLSIVRWEPIVGALPPLNETDWERVFALYRESPQFRLVNHQMDLAEFKGIFWWEYFHRLLGRSIGLIVGLPLGVFAVKRMIDKRRALSLAGIFCLGGLQGLVGWLMVKSGLVDQPAVSHYRLTLHLGLGFLLFALVLWQAMAVTWGPRRSRAARELSEAGIELSRVRRLALGLVVALSVTTLSGALVAGLRSGHAFPTFPLIAGYWVPPGMLASEPWWRNFLDSAVTVQFQHRVLALSTAAFAVGLWLWARKRALPPTTRDALRYVVLFVALQVALGIATLLLHVPVAVAALHQLNAALLLGASLNLVHTLRVVVPWECALTSIPPRRDAALSEAADAALPEPASDVVH